MQKTTALAPYARLPRAYRDHHVLTSTVDAFGRAQWLLTDQAPKDGPYRAYRPYDAAVVTVDDGRFTTTELSALTAHHPRLDTLPDGGFVVADARSRAPERQVQVFDALGRESWTFRVGDAVEHLLTDESGALWTGYFDEGVFGGDELSWAGLRRWGTDGEALWTYDGVAGGEISDCYALNVHRTQAWACAYHHFALLEIRPGRKSGPEVVAWANPVRAAKALAVRGERVAFFGGYGDEHDRLVECELVDGEVRPLVTGRLTRPDGRRIGRRRVVARGPRIHVQEEPYTDWAVLDLGA
ncbi:hypothetical protein [Streptomyces vilmorinianum]|uniref:hypothetical protein n=1 Tax=Streptomyces vilmorinianum TaxID=3051092 RepID=UPI0010FB73E3|nr:hypothetical protein [Streptomyces vilmorinianum]